MSETFNMIPAKSSSVFFIGIIGLILICLLVLFYYINHSSKNTKFIVSPEGLRITGTLYGRTIPKDQLLIQMIKSLNLKTDDQFRPKWRTNGIGLPQYQAGWFKLNNGEKALLFLTDKNNVVYIPTKLKYSILISVPDTSIFIDSLKKIVIY